MVDLVFRAFDVELLYIAQRLNIPITEVAVNWQEIDGTKLIKYAIFPRRSRGGV
jgi:hypothetical protein